MLLHAAAEDARKDISIEVFATDPAEEALARARIGRFAGAVAETMPPETLRRFFEPDGDGYVAKQPLRESIVFAPQNLLADPPFSRLDLVCCRNLLIYLQPEAQERVLSLLHFSLREGGFLFLGAAESAGERSPIYEPVIALHRIYRRVRAADGEDMTRLLISFVETSPGEPPAPPPAPATIDKEGFEAALRRSREELRDTIAQLEQSTRPCSASNEEARDFGARDARPSG